MQLDPVSLTPVPSISGQNLLSSATGISTLARVEVTDFSNSPSAYMGPEEWVMLTMAVEKAASRDAVVGVVVSHGTDTLEETAYWLDLTLKTQKPVVLTGAQRNASEHDSDGPRNLLNAVRVAISPESVGMGVLVAMNNQISAAREVVKTHTMNVDSFKCGDSGYLGSIDPDRVIYSRKPNRRQYVPVCTVQMPMVEIIAAYGGCDGSALREAVVRGAQGIVVQALGMGNVNSFVFDAVKFAIASGTTVVIASRVPNGRVLPAYGFQGGGATLQGAGAIFSEDLTPAKARILLMLLLQTGVRNPSELQAAFSK